MPDQVTVRLEILKVLLPAASRAGITDPKITIDIATQFSDFVLESAEQGATMPDAPGKRGPGRPRKEKPDTTTPDFMTPPPVDKSNQTLG